MQHRTFTSAPWIRIERAPDEFRTIEGNEYRLLGVAHVGGQRHLEVDICGGRVLIAADRIECLPLEAPTTTAAGALSFA